MNILVTGGTGVLGSALLPQLRSAGHHVRIMSRSPQRANLREGVSWAQVNLETGAGLAEAVNGMDAVIHAASNPVQNTQVVDVEGTQRLLDASEAAKVSHFLYVSINGIDRIPMPYYSVKLAAEKRIEQSNVPWSIQRMAQLHPLIDFVLARLARRVIMIVPGDFQAQPMAPQDAAAYLVKMIQQEPGGHLPDVGGREILRAHDMAKSWRAVRGVRRPMLSVWFPGKMAHGFRMGYNTAPDNRFGSVTWTDWLEHEPTPAYTMKAHTV